MNAATQAMILQQKIEQAEQVIYSAVIDKRVADKCDDKQMSENAAKLAAKWEKIKDQYETMLKELQPIP